MLFALCIIAQVIRFLPSLGSTKVTLRLCSVVRETERTLTLFVQSTHDALFTVKGLFCFRSRPRHMRLAALQ